MPCPPHPADRAEVRKRRSVGGGLTFAFQCQACFVQVGGLIQPERLADPRNVLPWSKGRAQSRRARDFAARFKRQDWKRIRKLVLERDRFTCRHCGEVATDVHHRTYDRFGDERLSDLESLCRDCNLAEREHRITGLVMGRT